MHRRDEPSMLFTGEDLVYLIYIFNVLLYSSHGVNNGKHLTVRRNKARRKGTVSGFDKRVWPFALIGQSPPVHNCKEIYSQLLTYPSYISLKRHVLDSKLLLVSRAETIHFEQIMNLG